MRWPNEKSNSGVGLGFFEPCGGGVHQRRRQTKKGAQVCACVCVCVLCLGGVRMCRAERVAAGLFCRICRCVFVCIETCVWRPPGPQPLGAPASRPASILSEGNGETAGMKGGPRAAIIKTLFGKKKGGERGRGGGGRTGGSAPRKRKRAQARERE